MNHNTSFYPCYDPKSDILWKGKQKRCDSLILQEANSAELVDKAREIAESLDFKCDFLEHFHTSGRTSKGASRALGVELDQIIKCLLLKSKKHSLIFAIVRGDTNLSMKKLESVTGEKKLSLVAKDRILTQLVSCLEEFHPLLAFT